MRMSYCVRNLHNPLRICGILRKVLLQQLLKLRLIEFDKLTWHDTLIERIEICSLGNRHHVLI